MNQIEVGREIEAYCTKCKTDTIHNITTVEDAKITKVMCQLCFGYHKYKEPASATAKNTNVSATAKKTAAKKSTAGSLKVAAPKKRTVKRVRKTTKAARKPWDVQIEEIDQSSVIDYNLSENYENGGLLKHKKFGLGVIQDVMAENKMAVLFEEGLKTLVQNWQEE